MKSLHRKMITAAGLTLLTLLPFQLIQAQNQSDIIKQSAPRLFLDCGFCFEDYIRDNVQFVNYVRDKNDADIHLLITQARTGSGGTEYTLKFIGNGKFAAKSDTLVYVAAESDTRDEEREGLVRYVRLGLGPFVSETPLIQYADFTFDRGDEEESSLQQREDKWNNWVFDINMDGSMRGEERRQSYELRGGFSASRITHDWKIDLDTDYDYEKENIEITEDDSTTTTIESIETSKSFDGLIVRSLSPHWSAGLSSEISSSTFSNIEFEVGGSPAIEYNVFPYREYNRHELLIQYRLTPTYMSYRDTTIFNKTEEFLVQQQLEASLEITDTWGSVNASVEGSHYFHDASKNRLDMRASVDFRIFRGLSLDISGSYSLINDQITLPKEGVSEREALLRLRERATGYEFRASVGISYTFGSIYNNIVNPRFGGGGGGFRRF